MKLYHIPEDTLIYRSEDKTECVIRSLDGNDVVFFVDYRKFSMFFNNFHKAFNDKYKKWNIYPAQQF